MRFNIFIAFLLISFTVRADTWTFSGKVETERFKHGVTQVVLTSDSRKNSKAPQFLLEVFTDAKKVASVPGVYFEKLFASKDNRYFLGLSNRGIPGTAAILFNSKGEMLLLVHHGVAEFDYCAKSITVSRVWFHETNPNVRFQIDEPKLESAVYLQNCYGKEVELFKVVLDAYAKSAKTMK
jgi:hypothetical protein